jgi:hypothetical protein
MCGEDDNLNKWLSSSGLSRISSISLLSGHILRNMDSGYRIITGSAWFLSSNELCTLTLAKPEVYAILNTNFRKQPRVLHPRILIFIFNNIVGK